MKIVYESQTSSPSQVFWGQVWSQVSSLCMCDLSATRFESCDSSPHLWSEHIHNSSTQVSKKEKLTSTHTQTLTCTVVTKTVSSDDVLGLYNGAGWKISTNFADICDFKCHCCGTSLEHFRTPVHVWKQLISYSFALFGLLLYSQTSVCGSL